MANLNAFRYNTGNIVEKDISKSGITDEKFSDPIIYDIITKSNTDKLPYRIIYILPDESKTEYDVLSEYINSDGSNDKIIFIYADTAKSDKSLILDRSKYASQIEKATKVLFELGFARLHFSSDIDDHTRETFIYYNEAGVDFINELHGFGLLQSYIVNSDADGPLFYRGTPHEWNI